MVQKIMPDSHFYLHSGGAIGSDTLFSELAFKTGRATVVSHSFAGHTLLPCVAKISTVIIHDQEELDLNIDEMKTVARMLKKQLSNKQYIKNLILRNYFQVSNSSLIVAVGNVLDKGNVIIEGGTGYAVKLAHQHVKPILVYCQIENRWMCSVQQSPLMYLNRKPELSRFPESWAGIGTRKLTQAGISAVEEIFQS